jgi:hypothetical protein
MLSPDDRVWVNVPTRGYVGVGIVSGAVVPLEELTVTVDGNDVLFASLPEAEKYRGDVNPENQALFVPITWVHSVPLAEAVKEVGFFGNQNTVAKPKSEKWEHTVAVLKQRFGI